MDGEIVATGFYQIKDADNEGTIKGTIERIKEVENGKIIFYLRHCKTHEVDAEKEFATVKQELYPFTAGGACARLIRTKYQNGSLVKINYFVSQSDHNGSIKFVARFITDGYPVVKTGAEMRGGVQ